MEVKLTDQQESAKKLIKLWYSNICENTTTTATVDDLQGMVFTLSGLAGTGKTFLIKYLVDNVLNINEYDVVFVTPTGKAASVLSQKGTCNVSTIHRLIYHTDSDERQVVINGELKIKRKLRFKKKKHLEHKYKLIILDEVSMISKTIMNDLLSFGIPVLATGDSAQLPPVSDESCKLLENPDFTLTEIVRQAEDNPIIAVSKLAREHKKIEYGTYGENGEVEIIDRRNLSEEELISILLSADQVVCGLNNTRERLNKLMRESLGYSGEQPQEGEKLICNLNNYEIALESNLNDDNTYFLVNGLIGRCSDYKYIDKEQHLASLSFSPDFLGTKTEGIRVDSGIFETGNYTYPIHQNIYELKDNKFAVKQKLFKRAYIETDDEWKARVVIQKRNERNAIDEFMLNMFDYGYAISCHKSQGSEFNYVVVFDESYAFKEDSAKWLYTAITRAKEKLIILK